ncbi:MAG: hypothetical protein GX771_06565 [Halomonadaceae bacterium]|nr:hypothetical protein [Halomonadaceae bacterium]
MSGGEGSKQQAPHVDKKAPSLKKAGTPAKPEAKPGIRMANREERGPLPLNEGSVADESPSRPEMPSASPAPDVLPARSEASEAEAWLKGCGNDASVLLLNIFKDIQLGIVEKNAMFGSEGGVAYLRYPDAVRPYGKPSDIAQMFSSAGWLVPDPENPMRKARDMGGSKAIVFSTELGEKLLPLLRHGVVPPRLEAPKAPAKKLKPTAPQAATEPKRQPENKPIAPAKTETANAIDNGRPPAQKRVINSEATKAAEMFIKAVRSGKIPPAQTRTSNDITYITVRMHHLSKYSSERISPTALREALERREDAEIKMNDIVVEDK